MALDSDAIEDALDAALAGPKSVSVDGQSVEQHKIGDLIDGLRYATGATGVGRNHRGLRITKLVPPGATSDQ